METQTFQMRHSCGLSVRDRCQIDAKRDKPKLSQVTVIDDRLNVVTAQPMMIDHDDDGVVMTLWCAKHLETLNTKPSDHAHPN